MAFAIARRYPSAFGRLVSAKRIPLARRHVSFIAPRLNRGVPSGGPQITQLLPLRLKNGYATTAKSSTTKKESTGNSATKTKKKKASPKRKQNNTRGPRRSTLSPAEKQAREEVEARRALKRKIKALREAALTPPKQLPSKAHLVAFPGRLVGKGESYYGKLSDEEKAKLHEQAEANKKENKIAYENWVNSHSARDIRDANQARAALRRLKYHPRRYADIKDDRQVKRINGAYTHFSREAHAMGELDGLTIPQMGTRLGEMWRSMTETEKNKYRKMHEADVVRYEEEYRQQYHEEPPARRPRSTSPADS